MTILCTIDLETREVSIPSGQCIAAYDHNVDVIRFQAETIPGFSLDTSTIRIAAQGPNKARHDYAVDPSTVSIEEETGYITFDWPIPAGVTEMPIGTFKYGDKGQLIFAVCAEIISGDTVSKAWHSDDGIITVVAHLEPEAGGGEDPEEEATNAQKIAQLQTNVAVMGTQIGALANGSPTPVATVAEMTDESSVYLYTGSETGYTAGNWYYYNGSAWTSGGVYGGAVTDVTDTTLSISGAPADAKAVGDALADKADSSDDYIPIDGENQVTPQNIAGMQFTKTERTVDGENIFSADMLFRNGQYVISADGTVSIGSNASYNAYCVPVEQNSTYVFPECRFVVLATGNTPNSPTTGDTIQNATQVNTGEATYLFLSYDDKPVGEITVKKREEHSIVYSDFILPDWLVNNLPIPAVVEKPKFATVTGDIASGGNLQLPSVRNNLRKGERIVFEGNISSFESIRIGLSFSTAVGTDGNQMNTFRIDGTNISYYARSNSTPVTVPHGLTIANNIQIIWEMSAVASCKITLISDGNLFVHEFTNFTRQLVGSPFVLSDGTVLTDCKLTWTCNDIDKPIWMFGDSYFAYSDARWTYYLHQYGYDQNCLLDGFPGEGGVNGRVAFNNLLQYGTPKVAVWCLGMNDTTDSESAPATDWVTSRDYFLQYCQNNNVTPIFGTIPTVPSINHEQKNAWIRSSGYRYIDFAKAVGASASGVWYGDMLASDNVHPSASGAKALFARVLLDLPEIMVDDF